MPEYLNVDFESRSTVDLRRTGVYPYAEDPDTEIICMAYCFGEGPVQVWCAGDSFPDEINQWVYEGNPLRAFNAQFERIMWRDCLTQQVRHLHVPELEQWVCTAAEAMAMALPRSLGWCAEVLGLEEQKDDMGRRLVLQMAKPRRIEDDGTVVWWRDADRMERLIEYCRQDVRVERAISKRVRRLPPTERQVYLLDQRINDRGVLLDIPLVKGARKVVEEGTDRANERLRELTDGEVSAVTKVADLTEWLQDQGAEIENIQKATLRDFLDNEDFPNQETKEVAELRLRAGKSSTAKLDAMERARCSDDRVRGLLLYHGASTGRWTGKLVQPQNFPRGSVDEPEQYIPDVLEGEAGEWEDPPLAVVSSLLRGMFRASPDCRIMAGDFSQIEARVLGWIAGEPYGDMEYERMAAAIFGVPLEDVSKRQRQVGKVAVLGAGFQMGPGRYQDTVKQWTGQEITEEVAERAIDTFRSRKPGVKQFWYDIEDAAKTAVGNPGIVTKVGEGSTIRYSYRGEFLWCVLPSGRPLAYALPRIELRETPWGEMRPGLTYQGVNSYTRKWERMDTYGGHLTENVVQAMARDLLSAAMLRLEDAGYPLVLSVHDEVVADVPESHGSLEEYLEIMEECPDWAEGIPIEVEGFEGERYRK